MFGNIAGGNVDYGQGGGGVWKEKFNVTWQTEKFNEKFDEKFNVTGQTDRVYLRLTRFITLPLILTLLVGGHSNVSCIQSCNKQISSLLTIFHLEEWFAFFSQSNEGKVL